MNTIERLNRIVSLVLSEGYDDILRDKIRVTKEGKKGRRSVWIQVGSCMDPNHYAHAEAMAYLRNRMRNDRRTKPSPAERTTVRQGKPKPEEPVVKPTVKKTPQTHPLDFIRITHSTPDATNDPEIKNKASHDYLVDMPDKTSMIFKTKEEAIAAIRKEYPDYLPAKIYGTPYRNTILPWRERKK